MTFRESIACRILLLLAQWLGPEAWKDDLRTLDVHIRVNAPDKEQP